MMIMQNIIIMDIVKSAISLIHKLRWENLIRAGTMIQINDLIVLTAHRLFHMQLPLTNKINR